MKITTNNFIADRDPTLAKVKDRVNGIVDLEALEAYFAAHKIVDPPKKSRLSK